MDGVLGECEMLWINGCIDLYQSRGAKSVITNIHKYINEPAFHDLLLEKLYRVEDRAHCLKLKKFFISVFEEMI